MYSIYWMRRDLRLHDNAALYHALNSKYPVKVVFIFDSNILDKLPKYDGRVLFIHRELSRIKSELNDVGSDLFVYHGDPVKIWGKLVEDEKLRTVFYNRDYEPYTIQRDKAIDNLLISAQIKVQDYKDHVIFDKGEITKADGNPYLVFTPYKRKWLDKLESGKKSPMDESAFIASYPCGKYYDNFYKCRKLRFPSLQEIGFDTTNVNFPAKEVDLSIIANYDKTRNIPAIDGTSKLGVHLRFGTISIRELMRLSLKLNMTFVSELIWREFYSSILYHFPYVLDRSFRKKYDYIDWNTNADDFNKWKLGQTGYAIVDAGMRELNNTGYMHNRVRMITASFLTKHLLIHWVKGERYFAEKLLDYDLASNNGGWQWAAGTGTDAAPYFRIFNPYTQMKKFDPDLRYIKKWVPEYSTKDYVPEMIPHKYARNRALEVYKDGLAKAKTILGDDS